LGTPHPRYKLPWCDFAAACGGVVFGWRFLMSLVLRSCRVWMLLLLACGWGSVPARSAITASEVPAFQLRARVVKAGANTPEGKSFTLSFEGLPQPSAKVEPSAWSEWLPFESAQIELLLARYPNSLLHGFPFVLRLLINGATPTTSVQAELKLSEGGQVIPLRGELLGARLGIMLWRDKDGKAQAGTMADYNRRYWPAFEHARPADAKRPRLFPLVDRFVSGDDDLLAWREGIGALSRGGFNALMVPPSRELGSLLREKGLRTAWATYTPEGGVLPFSENGEPSTTPEDTEKWAQSEAKPYLDAGFAPREMAMFAMSDEPGWYYPHITEQAARDAEVLIRFRKYLRAQGLSPTQLGAAAWLAVMPSTQRHATSLPQKRLFYWTARFFNWDSSQHYARSVRALEKAFYPGLPVYTNFNNFAGRFYTPGPFGNNGRKDSPDAAIAAQDWPEFGRARAGTLLVTEDWFSDANAPQWSFYMARLGAAGRRSGVDAGAFLIPRVAGDRPDGLLQKILTIAGSGGKGIHYFVFGPEYVFPGNCYSERDLETLVPQMARAHSMIAESEDVLWPARRQPSPVAILSPRSANAWDARDENGVVIVDPTNTNQNSSTVDYQAEVFNLYTALQHANVPADFVDEDDLSPAGLSNIKVLYVTEPDIPEENQRALVQWVRGGGTLVTVSGAGARDRYDEPCSVLSAATGLGDARPPLLLKSGVAVPVAGRGRGATGDFTAYGARGTMATAANEREIEAKFEDGSAAIVSRGVGRGRAVHFAWLPGLSYFQSATATASGLKTGYSEPIRNAILSPVRAAGVEAPVVLSMAQVEAPMLVAKNGAVVTLLNWTGSPQPNLQMTVRAPFAVRSARSTTRGDLKFSRSAGGITLSLPLDAADIVVLRP